MRYQCKFNTIWSALCRDRVVVSNLRPRQNALGASWLCAVRLHAFWERHTLKRPPCWQGRPASSRHAARSVIISEQAKQHATILLSQRTMLVRTRNFTQLTWHERQPIRRLPVSLSQITAFSSVTMNGRYSFSTSEAQQRTVSTAYNAHWSSLRCRKKSSEFTFLMTVQLRRRMYFYARESEKN